VLACSARFPLPRVDISTEQQVSSRIGHWALSPHFKRALGFHLGVLAVKWHTLKIAWTSTSKCCSCYYSHLCATQPLVRRRGSRDQAELVAERRALLSALKPPQPAGLLPEKAIRQGTPHSQATSYSLCSCRLLPFTISSSLSSRQVSHSPALLFLPTPRAWATPFPCF